jgi:hypothetical protein
MIGAIRKILARRKVVRDATSSDWGLAEKAIKAIPSTLDRSSALGILLPLSRGQGSRLAGRLDDLPATPTYEMSAGVHLRSAIVALGQIADPAASQRLLEIVSELPAYASAALQALGSPSHATAADQLAAMAENWPLEAKWKASRALWNMGTEHAFALYMKIEKAAGTARSEQVMRDAWTSHWKK